jgi:hypothetical protein
MRNLDIWSVDIPTDEVTDAGTGESFGSHSNCQGVKISCRGTTSCSPSEEDEEEDGERNLCLLVASSCSSDEQERRFFA